MKVSFGNVMKGAINASLKEGEEGFCRISVKLPANLLLGAVVHGFMSTKVTFSDPVMRTPLISHDDRREAGFVKYTLPINKYLASTLSLIHW